MLLNVNGINLFYTALGSDRPMMLMHGEMGLNHSCLCMRPWA